MKKSSNPKILSSWFRQSYSPFNIKNIKTGDKVSIKKEDVEDWIIKDLKTGKQTGYFSEKYLKSKG